MKNKSYFLGLDIGTDSVGYAAADQQYRLCKYKGEPVWGTTMFEAANLAEGRRSARTARRRLDRRQQRVALLEELFAAEIGKIDPNFFIRRRESALFPEDTKAGVKLFEGGLTDEDYHKRYPTIHHLIVELMNSNEPHDVRLVYIACTWLVAHRGHFLFDAADKVDDFGTVYRKLCDYFKDECECELPWGTDVQGETLLEIMTAQAGIKRKQELFAERLYGGKKPPKKPDEDFPYSRAALVALLCGGKVAPKELFDDPEYAEIESVSLGMDEENFARILAELGEDGELLRRLRAMYDCALLTQTLDGHSCISEAKVAVYEQHKSDLAYLKHFVRKYAPEKYDQIFRAKGEPNYVAYSGNVKSCRLQKEAKRVPKEAFCDFLRKKLDGIAVEEADRQAYENMLERLRQYAFLPKQRDSDNRVIPHQLYYAELECLLNRASAYLPMLLQKDENSISNMEKIQAIFAFRIPYYVGPLNRASANSWVIRKNGRIYPWNFDAMVDLDATEQQFIQRMTNFCTYLPGEEVLPIHSLLYSRFMVLNEINNLTINGQSIPVEIKQKIFTDVFEKDRRKKITPKVIREYLAACGCLNPSDELGGIDITIKASLKSYRSFRQLLASKVLSEAQVEDIIRHAAYSEDKSRMDRWLTREYPELGKDDRRYILRLNLKEFGRLSARLLTGIYHTDPETGEARSIMDMLWQTNENLMQLLSERYSFRQQIEDFAADYYAAHPQTLSERLDEMYISNAVKRPIIRTLKVTEEVVTAMGGAPEKIFIEMARDSGESQRGQRTKSRRQQILELYKNIKTEEARALEKELLDMGEMVDNRLQGDKLFLYYMQLGHCMYTGERIELSQLATKAYDIDHIYPQSKVQDDSILNNKVLCVSAANGAKSDRYPIDSQIQAKMRPWWENLLNKGLITKEKFNRLTRVTPFSEEELHQFINRQLVETRQSTKAVAQLLRERYPETQIVYVKAGLVSRFRQEFDLLKCRAVNDLHHAKDAYLNIVAGNVYHERFTKRWFNVSQTYSLNTKAFFRNPVVVGGKTIWRGNEDVELVQKIMAKNAVHLTRYAFCRKGGLFDQQPVKAGSGLVPRKAGLPSEKYGGYRKTTASFYLLASYSIKGQKDIMFVPIELMHADRVMADRDFAAEYIERTISGINGGKAVEDVQLLLGGRKIKINTVIEADGMRLVLKGKDSGGKRIIVSSCMPLVLGAPMERYIKRLEVFAQKRREGAAIKPDSTHDGITAEENIMLYDVLYSKLTDSILGRCPGGEIIAAALCKGKHEFVALSLENQILLLLNLVLWFGSASTCDFASIGGAAKAGSKLLKSYLSAWKKQYSDVRIVDVSASGLFSSRSENLLELL